MNECLECPLKFHLSSIQPQSFDHLERCCCLRKCDKTIIASNNQLFLFLELVRCFISGYTVESRNNGRVGGMAYVHCSELILPHLFHLFLIKDSNFLSKQPICMILNTFLHVLKLNEPFGLGRFAAFVCSCLALCVLLTQPLRAFACVMYYNTQCFALQILEFKNNNNLSFAHHFLEFRKMDFVVILSKATV